MSTPAKTPKELEEQGMIIGTCEWCHDENVPIYKETDRCETCEEHFIYCSVCKEEQFEDDPCRHIFWTDSGWSGSGGEYSETEIRASLIALIQPMPQGFAQDLKAAIQSGKFRTFTIGCMFGSVSIIELHGLKYASQYSRELIALGKSDLAEQSSDGWNWLVSLEEDKTTEANALTIKWIDEFISQGETKHES
jgi:hypothetical protein